MLKLTSFFKTSTDDYLTATDAGSDINDEPCPDTDDDTDANPSPATPTQSTRPPSPETILPSPGRDGTATTSTLLVSSPPSLEPGSRDTDNISTVSAADKTTLLAGAGATVGRKDATGSRIH
ncbi:hypothetical protein AAFF_G00153020 [Aldrovandia affinis]|uniref:Uncharacterized protein n=1 Tax=Aldrovandia affinis TaxID=143900 RepID=A0AAD7RRF4_9TELE|nr:hypothetical protein AAFF_G00153020 [Aldrovandia affinis]